jgi:hypothetical protein
MMGCRDLVDHGSPKNLLDRTMAADLEAIGVGHQFVADYCS